MRTFIAVDMPEGIRQEVAGFMAQLQKCNADVKWTEKENLHITLKFFGDITESQLDTIKTFLEKLSSKEKTFPIRLTTIGAFPDLNEPRIFWIGIGEGKKELVNLATTIESGLESLGFPRETRAFSAHLTLGRTRSRKNLKSLLSTLKTSPFKLDDKIQINQISFYRSILDSHKPVYEIIRKNNLLGS